MGERLALVLPGRGYTALGPAIRFPVLALAQRGFQVREIVYPEVNTPLDEFPWDDFSTVTAARIEVVLHERDWTETIVVAKSLGTGVLAHAGPRLNVPSPRAIWLTPMFGIDHVRRGAIELGWPSLIVAGSADASNDPSAFREVSQALAARTLLIEGADHSLEVSGDARDSLAAMAQLVDAVAAFAE